MKLYIRILMASRDTWEILAMLSFLTSFLFVQGDITRAIYHVIASLFILGWSMTLPTIKQLKKEAGLDGDGADGD